MIIRFIPAIFTVIQYRHTVISFPIGQVGPILGINFISIIPVISPLYAT